MGVETNRNEAPADGWREPWLMKLARVVPLGAEPLLARLARDEPRLQDYTIRVRGSDIPLRADLREAVFALLFRWGNFPNQSGLDIVASRLVKPGQLVFDIGANVGFPTVLFSTLVGPAGRVVAFEPAPKTFALLHRSLSGIANIELVEMAVSDRAGTAEFYVPYFIDVASLQPQAGATAVSVKTQTLDALAGTYGMPDFLKIDVEGFEHAVFRGGAGVLREARPIIVFEAIRTADRDASIALIRELSGDRYEFRRITRRGALVAPEARGYRDYVALPKGRTGG